MLATIGACLGVETYSRHLSGRGPGDRPGCLIDYFPRRRAPGEAGSGSAHLLLVIDESHVTVPQIGGMYEGDPGRKPTPVDFGFPLASALGNRPPPFYEVESLPGPG